MSFPSYSICQCLSLADMPLACPLLPRNEDRGIGRRILGKPDHRVVGDLPACIDVLHSARNYRVAV